MVKEDRSTWKSNYFLKIAQLLDEYPKCFIANADNVGSKQMQLIRAALRGKGVNLIKEGDKVGLSESTLLNMLKISPFYYGLGIQNVYDNGTIFEPAILDIKDEDLRERFMLGVRNIAALSLMIGYPTVASAPHSMVNGFKRLLAIAVGTDFTFKQAEKTKEYLADPSKFAAAATPAAAAAPAAGGGKKEEKKPEPEEESDDDMGFGLFD
ncbi:RP-LP0 [Mytilus edulis]|uniref:Large ribosomal subunit protein uL10 n=1 Tax=Mytilus edulis TaxID=6550 RepID=A0A8S3SHX7_MYTED|nr:RP-LP0 [Mytilus edulis]